MFNGQINRSKRNDIFTNLSAALFERIFCKSCYHAVVPNACECMTSPLNYNSAVDASTSFNVQM